ncbi:MAG TPA: thymidine kinase [Blastocatellia bacterium]
MDVLNHRGGWIEVIAGGMFSGKSEELIRRVRRAEIARQRTQIFKPAIDSRFDAKRIISRDNRGIDAIAVANTAELRANLVIGVKVVGIDEVQFFDNPIVDLCMELADAGEERRRLPAPERRDSMKPAPRPLFSSRYACIRVDPPADRDSLRQR